MVQPTDSPLCRRRRRHRRRRQLIPQVVVRPLQLGQLSGQLPRLRLLRLQLGAQFGGGGGPVGVGEMLGC